MPADLATGSTPFPCGSFGNGSPHGLTTQYFIEKMDGTWLETPSGNFQLKVWRDSELHDSFNFEIFDQTGIKVGRGWKDIRNGDLEAGGIFLRGETERNRLYEILDHTLQIELHSLRSEKKLGDLRFDYEFDWPNQKLKQIKILNLKGEDYGHIDFTGSDPAYSPGSAEKFDPTVLPEMPIVMRSSVKQVLASKETRKIFRSLANGPEVVGKGIGSSLYDLYGRLVPTGTRLKIEITNRETLRHMEQEQAKLEADPRYSRLPAAQRERQLKALLNQHFASSKWGKVLAKTSWQVQEILPSKWPMLTVVCVKKEPTTSGKSSPGLKQILDPGLK